MQRIGAPKVKLYKDSQGQLKGDALVTYFKPESVQLACTILDETHFRPEEVRLIQVQQVIGLFFAVHVVNGTDSDI